MGGKARQRREPGACYFPPFSLLFHVEFAFLVSFCSVTIPYPLPLSSTSLPVAPTTLSLLSTALLPHASLPTITSLSGTPFHQSLRLSHFRLRHILSHYSTTTLNLIPFPAPFPYEINIPTTPAYCFFKYLHFIRIGRSFGRKYRCTYRHVRLTVLWNTMHICPVSTIFERCDSPLFRRSIAERPLFRQTASMPSPSTLRGDYSAQDPYTVPSNQYLLPTHSVLFVVIHHTTPPARRFQQNHTENKLELRGNHAAFTLHLHCNFFPSHFTLHVPTIFPHHHICVHIYPGPQPIATFCSLHHSILPFPFRGP